MYQFFTERQYTNDLLEIAVNRGAVDRIAACDCCMEKEWLCGYGRMTEKGFHKVTRNFHKPSTKTKRIG
jgi:hypothetical protein